MRSDLSPDMHPPTVPPLLITENQDEYDAFVAALKDEIKPTTMIEEIFVDDVIEHCWHIRRFRLARAVIINIGYYQAIVELLGDISHCDEFSAEDIARKWFTSRETKIEVAGLLRRYNLDESAIAAEAIKLNASELEKLGKQLAFWEKSRNKALRHLKKQLAKRVMAATEKAIEFDGSPESIEQAAAE